MYWSLMALETSLITSYATVRRTGFGCWDSSLCIGVSTCSAGLQPNTETESSDTDSEDGALHEVEAWPCEQSHVTGARLAVWPADAALSRWRDASRECHLYAYAPPTRYLNLSSM